MEQQKLPNATLILVFGILSIVTCCCYGIIGLIFGIIALVLANKSTKIYQENPQGYSDFGNVKTGKILAIIGIILSLLMIATVVWSIATHGWDNMQDPAYMEELMKQFE